jgi:hypothetical protein
VWLVIGMTDDMGQLGTTELDEVELDDEEYDEELDGEGEESEAGWEEAAADLLQAVEAIYDRLDDLLTEQQDTNRFLAMLVAASGRPQDAQEAEAYLQELQHAESDAPGEDATE